MEVALAFSMRRASHDFFSCLFVPFVVQKEFLTLIERVERCFSGLKTVKFRV